LLEAIDLTGNREMLTAARVREVLALPPNPENVKSITLGTKSFGREEAAAAAEIIQSLPNLETVNFSDIISGRETSVGLEALKTLCEALPLANVKTLNLSDNAIGERGIRVLDKTFRTISPTIESLSFRNNGLSGLSLELLAQYLEQPSSLRELHFHSNMSDSHGAISLAPVFQKLGGVSDKPFVFSMTSCRVKPEVIVSICKSLEHVSDRLESLDLSDSMMGKDGGAALAKLLRKCTKLKRLVLCDPGLENADIESIIQSVGCLTELEHLDFSCAELGENHTALLLAVLAINCTKIKELNLAENEATNEGVSPFLSGPGQNLRFLSYLDFSANELDDNVIDLLVRSFAGRAGFQLQLRDNDFSEESVAKLRSSFGDRLGSMEATED